MCSSVREAVTHFHHMQCDVTGHIRQQSSTARYVRRHGSAFMKMFRCWRTAWTKYMRYRWHNVLRSMTKHMRCHTALRSIDRVDCRSAGTILICIEISWAFLVRARARSPACPWPVLCVPSSCAASCAKLNTPCSDIAGVHSVTILDKFQRIQWINWVKS